MVTSTTGLGWDVPIAPWVVGDRPVTATLTVTLDVACSRRELVPPAWSWCRCRRCVSMGRCRRRRCVGDGAEGVYVYE